MVDTTYPKIKYFGNSVQGDCTYTASTRQHFAVDTDGYVYAGGYGAYGSLWGSTSNQNYYHQRPLSETGGYGIEYATNCCDSYNRWYGINTQGELYSAGYNGYGAGGNNTTTNLTTITTAMTGSLVGKRVIHVNGTGGATSYGQGMALCDDGTVHFCGYDTHNTIGAGSGSYRTIWMEKSNASTTINSGARKVESI